MPQCVSDAVARNRVEEILKVDLEEEPIFNVAMQRRDMSSTLIVKKVWRKWIVLKKAKEPSALADAFSSGRENEFIARLIFMLVIDEAHCSWRPCLQFQSEA